VLQSSFERGSRYHQHSLGSITSIQFFDRKHALATTSSRMTSNKKGLLLLALAVSGLLVLFFVRLAIALWDTSPEPLWPEYLVSQVSMNTKRPTNTIEAAALQWEKSDEPCVSTLGEAWLYKGERGIETSATLYFSPEDGDVPGSLSGIEVDYYGYIEDNLVGSYFSEERTSKDGTYHSLAVALRNSANEDLCSKSAKRNAEEKYVAISPGLINQEIPMKNSSPLLTDTWKEGSCIPGMGYHWFTDTIGGNNLTYKAENTVPVVPMYDHDGNFVAIFFLATAKKQNWDATIGGLCPLGIPFTPECLDALNFWDPGPGLNEANEGQFYLCGNLCGQCDFTGSGSTPGMYTTMHWFFQDPAKLECVGSDKGLAPYCPSGSYPTMDDA